MFENFDPVDFYNDIEDWIVMVAAETLDMDKNNPNYKVLNEIEVLLDKVLDKTEELWYNEENSNEE